MGDTLNQILFVLFVTILCSFVILAIGKLMFFRDLNRITPLCQLCDYNAATDYTYYGNSKFNNQYALIECDSQHIIKNDGSIIYPSKWDFNAGILEKLDCNYKDVNE